MSDFLRLDMGPMSLIYAPGPLAKSRGTLYLGNITNALAEGQKLHKRFWAILNCTDDPALDPLNAEPGFEVFRLNQWDGEEYSPEKITQGIKFIDEHMQTASVVLVCCHAGCSRSPAIVLAYMLSKGYGYDEALRTMTKARDFIHIHPKIDASIRKYFGLNPIPDTIK